MANPNALIVEVVGDTTKLTKGLADAERKLNKFAGSSRSWGNRSGQAVADKELAGLQAQQDKLNQSVADLAPAAKTSKLALGAMSAAAVVGYQAVQKISAGLKSSGDEALTTGGRWRNAASSLLSLDAAGAVLAFDLQRTTGTVEQLTKAINDENAQNTINDRSITGIIDKTAKLIGIDRERERQLTRLTSLSAAYAAEIDDKMIGALQRLQEQAIDTGSALAFGERGMAEGRGPGAIAQQVPKPKPDPRKGISQTQRNRWFDSKIARELDRVQDIKTVSGQVSALKAIAGEIQKRIDATKDVTRRLNLEDQLVNVQRRVEDIQTDAAKAAAERARKLAEAEKLRLKRLKDAAAAKKKAQDVVGGPLTKTTQLSSERILAGVAMGAASRRILEARLSHFNSAGTALTGSGSGSGATFVSHTVIDGKVVATTSAKYNRRTRAVNTTQRNGPNAGRR